ncbi:MAG: leucine dehydrogenase [Myxococcota bacterium]|jgi:leucine dehydrogenase
MQPFEDMADLGHEQVLFCRNDDAGLRAIIAIHNTTLGPSLGGCRLWDYASTEHALRDVLRLSRGMTYKAAVAGLDLGGGKSVIIGDRTVKSEALFRAFGRHIESLNGRYITAEDMNTNVQDMNWIRRETKHVTGASQFQGGSGDPSPVTAWGVFHGLRACLEVVYGSSDVRGRTVAIQGVGNVGYNLARYLHERGAKVLVSDINTGHIARAVEEFDAEVLEGDSFYAANCDVLAPCAIGGIINERTIKGVRAPIVCGGANNILEDEERDGQLLSERGITYGPDYVVNAGGLMNVNAELRGWPAGKAMEDARGIFDTVKRVLHKATHDGTTTVEASNRLAEERIEAVANLRRHHVAR